MPLVRKAPAAKFEPSNADDPSVGQEPAATPAATPAAAPAETAAAQPSVGHATPAAGHPSRSTSLIRPVNTAVSTQVTTKFEPALSHMKDVVFVDFDTFPRLKAGPGAILDSEGKSLGRQIEMQVISWQDGWDLSPGEDTDEAKKAVAYSDDGVSVKGTGMLCVDYMQELREKGFKNAKMTHKCTLVGILEAAEKNTSYLGKTIQVSLSDQARKTFDRYRMDATIQAQMGKRPNLDGVEMLSITAKLRKFGQKDWTLLEVGAPGAEIPE